MSVTVPEVFSCLGEFDMLLIFYLGDYSPRRPISLIVLSSSISLTDFSLTANVYKSKRVLFLSDYNVVLIDLLVLLSILT